MFQDEYPDTKMGKDKFAELRSQHILLSNMFPHNVCLCKSHDNLIAAIDALHKAIPDFPIYTHSLPETFLCDTASEDCWIGTCNIRGRGQGFTSKYAHILQDEKIASWYVWRNDADNKL